jgi:hypothetical protein
LVQNMNVIYFLSYYCCCSFHYNSCPCWMGGQLMYCLHCPSTEISTVDMSMLVRLHDSIVTYMHLPFFPFKGKAIPVTGHEGL